MFTAKADAPINNRPGKCVTADGPESSGDRIHQARPETGFSGALLHNDGHRIANPAASAT